MPSARRSAFVLVLTTSLAACGGGGASTPVKDPGGGGGGGGGGTVMPPTTLDDGPVAAAQDVSDGIDPERISATIRQAMAQAGFDQLDESGNQLWPADAPAQGIAFEWGDAEILGEAMVGGPRIALDDLLAGWGAMRPSLTTAALRQALVADLGASAASTTSDTRRFWAQLIVALGRAAPIPYDLLDPSVAGDAWLDPIQVAFLSYRYAAELWLAGQKAGGLLRAAPVARARARTLAAATARPCTMTDAEGTVMDVAALGSSTIMGHVVEAAGELVPAAGKLSEFSGRAGAALLFVKMLWTFLAFDARMEAAAPRLVREWDGTLGQLDEMTATFQFKTGNGQVMNCIRPVLNLAGLDFSLPPDGPIAGARVKWELMNAYARDQKIGIVQFEAGTDQLNQRTSPEGQVKVKVQGTKRSPPLHAPVIPDYRMVGVYAKVALKDTKLGQDLFDAVGAALAGNPVNIMLSAMSETLMRANTMAFAAGYRLPVVDWEAGGGLIRLQGGGELSGACTAAGEGAESATLLVDQVRKQVAQTRPVQFVSYNGAGAYGFVELGLSGFRELSYQGEVTRTEPCLCTPLPGDATVHESESYRLGTVTDTPDDTLVVVLAPDGSYTFDLPIGQLLGTGRSHRDAQGCGVDPSSVDEKPAVMASVPTITITGHVDPAFSSGQLEGSWSGQVMVPVPMRLGAFYQGGVEHPDIEATFVVDYTLPYTLQKVTVPAGLVPPPAAARQASSSPSRTEWAGGQPLVPFTSPTPPVSNAVALCR